MKHDICTYIEKVSTIKQEKNLPVRYKLICDLLKRISVEINKNGEVLYSDFIPYIEGEQLNWSLDNYINSVPTYLPKDLNERINQYEKGKVKEEETPLLMKQLKEHTAEPPCYGLCRFILDHCNIKYLRPIAEALYLCIALENERNLIEYKAKQNGEDLTNAPINLELYKALEKAKKNVIREIPKELDTPQAKALLKRVIKNGYCDEQYNWNVKIWKTESEAVLALAYFVEIASTYLKLEKGERGIAWKPFEELFNYPYRKGGLRRVRMNYMRAQKETKFLPPKFIFNQITKLFE